MNTLRWHLLAITFALALPTASLAASPSSEDEDAQLAGWVQRLDEAKERLAASNERMAALNGLRDRASSRRYPRGDAKEKYLADLAAAQHEQADAARALPELIEEARRDGVPPGVLSDYEDYAAAHPPMVAANEDDDAGDDGDDMGTDTPSDDDEGTDTDMDDDMGTDTQEESSDS